MRRDILILIIAVVCVAALGTILSLLLPGQAHAGITSVATDKDLYHSKETMMITVSVDSQGNIGNATLRLLGIQDRYGDYQLRKDIPVNLSHGANTLVYDHKLPSCSSCSGLAAGTYRIDVSLLHDGVLLSNTTHSFQLA